MRRSLVAVLAAGCGFTPTPQGTGSGDDAPKLDAAGTCAPAQVACSGRTLRTCGADGMWNAALDHTCDFTCADSACVRPSNIDLPSVASCTSVGHALTPVIGAIVTISASSGTHIQCSPDCGESGITRIDPVATIASPAPGLTWFCLSSVKLPAGTTLALPPTGGPAEAIAFVVDGNVDISGAIAFDGGDASSATTGGLGAPGGFNGADKSSGVGIDGHGPCGGHGGDHDGSSSHWIGGGGGGGGGFTAGGGGGTGRCTNNDHTGNGSPGGGTCNTANLVPLLGGSGGGGGGDATTGVSQGWAGGGGGGALQISARGSIAVSGTISAHGGAGYGVSGAAGIDGGGGGGAGGGILLESPSIMVTGSIAVDGGTGGVAGAGPGGAGATGANGPTNGKTFTTQGQGGSGGGGAGGRIMLGGLTTCPANVSPVASCAAAKLATQ